MKALLCLLFISSVALADVTIVQKVESPMHSGEITLRIKGDKIRVDVSEAMSTLTDSATGDVTTLMHQQKTYMVIPASSTKVLYEKFQQMQNADKLSKPKLEETPLQEQVAGYNCKVYKAQVGNMKLTYWISKEYPNAEAILGYMAKVQSGKFGDLMGSVLPKSADFPGLPLKTVTESGDQKLVSTLVSVKEEELPESVVTVPGDYVAMPSPNFRGIEPGQ